MHASVLRESSYFEEGKLPPGKWIVTEKMDGHRKFWPGRGRYIYSYGRSSSKKVTKFRLPAKMAKQMPKVALDMEVCVAATEEFRNRERVLIGSNGLLPSRKWKKLHMYVFDMPVPDKSYSERWEALEALELPELPEFMSLVQSFGIVKDMKQLDEWLDIVVDKPYGEGLMLNEVSKPYQGRQQARDSEFIYKYKPGIDFEALVLQRSGKEGNGYICLDPLGREFPAILAENGGVLMGPVKRCNKKGTKLEDMKGTVVTVLHQGERRMDYDVTKKAKYENASVKEYDGNREWKDIVASGMPANSVRNWTSIEERDRMLDK
jgi:hypothetical protein